MRSGPEGRRAALYGLVTGALAGAVDRFVLDLAFMAQQIPFDPHCGLAQVSHHFPRDATNMNSVSQFSESWGEFANKEYPQANPSRPVRSGM